MVNPTARVLVTGSSGLVGKAACPVLRRAGMTVVGFDLKGSDVERGDIREASSVAEAVHACTGIVHLAAVSRVHWAESDPGNCRATNVDGLQNMLSAARACPEPPWIIFASSREVYGRPDRLPVQEDAPLRPINVYGRSKVEGERRVEAARSQGLRTAIARLASVYGSIDDHPDRVAPAFARAAILNQPLRVTGPEHRFDFVHVDDVTRGIAALAIRMEAGVDDIPPVHFVTGQATSLRQLAELSRNTANSSSEIVLGPPRDFDVECFQGDPRRARELLDWEARVSIRDGLGRLITDFRSAGLPATAG